MPMRAFAAEAKLSTRIGRQWLPGPFLSVYNFTLISQASRPKAAKSPWRVLYHWCACTLMHQSSTT